MVGVSVEVADVSADVIGGLVPHHGRFKRASNERGEVRCAVSGRRQIDGVLI